MLLNSWRIIREKGNSQTELAEKLNIGKQSISDYEKKKSYPTFANLDEIAQFFNASPNQLLGSSKDIELEQSVHETDEYIQKANKIVSAIKSFGDLTSYLSDTSSLENYTAEILNHLSKLTSRKLILDPATDEQLYMHIPTKVLVRAEDKNDKE